MLYKNSESVNFDIDPCHDIMYMCRCSCPSIPQRLRNQKKYPKKVSFRPTESPFSGVADRKQAYFLFWPSVIMLA